MKRLKEKRTNQNEIDNELIKKIKQKDSQAFVILIRLYQKKIFQLAYSFFQNREDAMDLMQETFLRVYEKINHFKEGNNFQNWIYRIAHNLCIDYYRKFKKRKSASLDREELNKLSLSDLFNSQDQLKIQDLKEVIKKSLAALSEKQRMIFVLKHYQQLRYSDIAQTLNISVGTVKSLHHRAVNNLRNIASQYLKVEK
ncbi:MAG: RNA polymerase sigma factor [Candidatus Aminicenantia bacterium]